VRRRALWWVTNVVVPVVFLIAMVWLVWARADDLGALVDDPGRELALIAVLVVVGHFCNSTEFWLLYRAQGSRIGIGENWMAFTAGQLGNLLPGQLGTVYKFRYMKTVHGLRYAESGSNYGANLVITLVAAAVVGITGIAFVGSTTGNWAIAMFAVFAVMGGVALASFVVPLPRAMRLTGTAGRAWRTFAQGWDELRRNRATAAGVCALDIAKLLFTAWRFDLAFGLVGIEEPFWFFAVIAPAASVAGTIAMTPGGLGIREAFVTAAAVGMGSTVGDGLLAATVDRAVMFVTAIAFGSVGFLVTWRNMRRVASTPESVSPGSPGG
jgi:glycosyltransferase 2 family protein